MRDPHGYRTLAYALLAPIALGVAFAFHVWKQVGEIVRELGRSA